jgi:ABC-type histidine transport system ATPase subunit
MGDFVHSVFDTHTILAVLPILLGEGLRNTLIIAAASLVLGLLLAMLFLDRGVIAEQGPARQWFVDPETTRLRSFLSQVL